MIKFIIEINTTDGEDLGSEKIYIFAPELSLALNDTKNLFRNTLKYKKLDRVAYDAIEKLQQEFIDIINDYGLSRIID